MLVFDQWPHLSASPPAGWKSKGENARFTPLNCHQTSANISFASSLQWWHSCQTWGKHYVRVNYSLLLTNWLIFLFTIYSAYIISGSQISVRRKTPYVTFSVIQELSRRNTLKASLSGRDEKWLCAMLAFLKKHISNPNYVSVVIEVTDIILGETLRSLTLLLLTLSHWGLYSLQNKWLQINVIWMYIILNTWYLYVFHYNFVTATVNSGHLKKIHNAMGTFSKERNEMTWHTKALT